MNADLTFERWGDNGWAFSDPTGRTSATLLVYPFGGGHSFAEVATAGTPDDDDLPARVLAGLADEVVALRAEIERLRGLLKAADEVLWNAPAPSTNEVGTDYYEAWQRWERLRVQYPEIGDER